jgi:hypothetical protein
MKKLMISVMFAGFLCGVNAAFGQQGYDPYNPPPAWVTRMDANRERMDRMNGRNDMGMIIHNPNFKMRPLPRRFPDGTVYTKEDIAKIEAEKKPDEADSAKFADFLKQPNTGLIRLFPYLPCYEKYLIRIDGECANFIPTGWAYSFRAKAYSDQAFFDLKLKDGNLITGSAISLGILTVLGDIPLENVSLTSDGMKFLAELKPETQQAESEKQMSGVASGIEADGYRYSNKVKFEEQKTYGLRVIAYRVQSKVRILLVGDPENGFGSGSFPLNKYDKRDDLTIVFRIVRKEEDGNITILWKELSRAEAPKLIFSKEIKSILIDRKPD